MTSFKSFLNSNDVLMHSVSSEKRVVKLKERKSCLFVSENGVLPAHVRVGQFELLALMKKCCEIFKFKWCDKIKKGVVKLKERKKLLLLSQNGFILAHARVGQFELLSPKKQMLWHF